METPLSYEQVVAMRKSPKAQRYQDFKGALAYTLENKSDPDVLRANEEIQRHIKSVSASDVHQNATLSNVSIQYANEDYIGEQLMPPVIVNKKSDIFYVYGKSDHVAYPDDALGERGQANEINSNRTTDTYACLSYGFENYVDGETLANQDAPLNEMVDLVEDIAEGMAFRRELRIAAKMCSTANYGAANTATATAIGGATWNSSGGGDPVQDIQYATKSIWNGRGPGDKVGFCSLDVYNVLSRHPAITDLYKYSGAKIGLATPDMIANFFGISKLLVGAAWKDTAKEGQTTASYSRIWSDVFGVVRVARTPSIRNAAFGYTFRFGQPYTIEWFDPKYGARNGGYFAKSTVSEDHKIVAATTGFLLTSVLT